MGVANALGVAICHVYRKPNALKPFSYAEHFIVQCNTKVAIAGGGGGGGVERFGEPPNF